ncbi:MAG: SpoIID/LytB domain-containing protein, partial [Ignavibacteriales bacterium]|nr:SpoIID/LytB domain-containing protein [Ignavibacteriales bacterium]
MRRFFTSILCIIFLTFFNVNAQFLFTDEPLVKVRIIYTMDSLEIIFDDEWKLNDGVVFGNGDTLSLSINDIYILAEFNHQIMHQAFENILLKSSVPNKTLTVKNVPFGIGWWWGGVEDRIYEGDIGIRINGNNLFDVIVTLPLETYLCGVVPYEIGADSPLEALKAQTIAARSETVEALVSGKYKGDYYDICADVECQVFAGNGRRTPLVEQAIEETRGLCLFYGDKVLAAYYASNCGGMSENVENVWPERSGPVPYWSSHFDSDSTLYFNPKTNPKEWIESSPDVYCNPEFHPELPEFSRTNFRWEVKLSNEELTKNLNEFKQIGILKNIEILERGNSGRIIKAKFIGTEDTLQLNSELDVRKMRNPPLRSSCFIIEKITSNDGNDTYILKGAGWGHGVGMCQSGAIARAFEGQNYVEILQHYYRDTEIKKVY